MLQDELVASRSLRAVGPPRIVLLVAPKGGVGKTTTVTALLVSARLAGMTALGVDMDDQESLVTWGVWRRGTIAANPALGLVDAPVRKMDLGEWRSLRKINNYDIVIVDTPPGIGEARQSIRSLCEVADIVLIPTSASPADLEKVVPFGRSIAGTKVFFVLNRINRRTRSWAQARVDLTANTRLAPSDIPALDVVTTQFGAGLTTTDMATAGADAFAALWNFVRLEIGLKSEAGING